MEVNCDIINCVQSISPRLEQIFLYLGNAISNDNQISPQETNFSDTHFRIKIFLKGDISCVYVQAYMTK